MTDDPAVPIGKVLRRLRKERGLTIEAAAARAKLNSVYYGEIERGKENPTVRVLDRMLDVLRCGWGDFGASVDQAKSELSS